MRKYRISILALGAAALAALTAGSALAATSVKPIVFTGTYSGTASTKIDGSTVTISANGSGKGTLIGAGKVVGNGTGDSSKQPCVPFGGTGSITGAAGAIQFKVLSNASGCGDEGGHVFSVTGYAQVLKATGKLAKAKGQLRFTGTYSRDDGTFSVKFTGTLKK